MAPTADLLRERLSRRRLIAIASSAAAGAFALSLSGCGDSNSGGGAKKNESSLIAEPVDSTSRAVKGGTFHYWQGDDAQTFDTLTNFAQDATVANYVYNRLVKWNVAKYPQAIQPGIQGDGAASWEISPDGMQVTYKVRPNLKLDARAPTNGRNMTASDFQFSFERYAAKGVNRTVLFNSADPEAAITSVSAPDASTFVIKLAFPYAPLNALLTFPRNIVMMPKEADGGFDVRSEARGAGMFSIKAVQRSTRYEYVKNPDWYDAASIKLDGITNTVIKDTATGTAQFRAGNLWTYPLNAEDIIPTKNALPRLIMSRDEQFAWHHDDIRFGYLPGSPFLDERVRKAVSLLIDRDLFIATFGNVKGFEQAGIEVPTRWNSAVPCSEDGYWLDPKSAEFGDNAKFYKFSPEEAKKLLKAAGAPTPIETTFTYSVGRGATEFERKSEVYAGMWQANGDFKLKINGVDHQTVFTPKYFQTEDKFDGIINHGLGSQPEVDSLLFYLYKSGIPRSGHLGADGKPDLVLDDMLAKQRREQDHAKRVALVKDIQKYAAGKMYLLHEPGSAIGYSLAWDWIGNWRTYRSKAGNQVAPETIPYLWYDASKKL